MPQMLAHSKYTCDTLIQAIANCLFLLSQFVLKLFICCSGVREIVYLGA